MALTQIWFVFACPVFDPYSSFTLDDPWTGVSRALLLPVAWRGQVWKTGLYHTQPDHFRMLMSAIFGNCRRKRRIWRKLNSFCCRSHYFENMWTWSSSPSRCISCITSKCSNFISNHSRIRSPLSTTLRKYWMIGSCWDSLLATTFFRICRTFIWAKFAILNSRHLAKILFLRQDILVSIWNYYKMALPKLDGYLNEGQIPWWKYFFLSKTI